MSARRRGLIIFAILVVVSVIFCGLLPFSIMPNAGIGMALPVIEVPGEVVQEGGLFGINLTNTFIGTIFTDIMLIIFVVLAWRASRGWTKEVPNRMQGLAEVIVQGLYNFCKGIAGDRLRTAPLLWPLVATIFLFLLAANMMKLFPGVETVGKMHCAHIGKNGYAMRPGTWTDNSYLLYVDAPLDSGTTQTEEGEHACADYFHGWKEQYKTGFPAETAAEIEQHALESEERISELSSVPADDLTEEAREELLAAEHYVALAPQRIASLEAIEVLDEQIAEIDAEIAHLEGATGAETDDHGEEAADDHADETEEAVVTEEAAATEEAGATEEAADDHSEAAVVEEEHAEDDGHGEEVAAVPNEELVADLTEQRDDLVAARNMHVSNVRFPGATLPLNEEQLDKGAVPYIFHVTPFFRGPATDLSLTIALAIMAMLLVQVYGIIGQGLPYFEKFINVSALGNLNKKPMGAIDFIVGIIEIISEIGKIVSLAFRLFGNLFAGGVALMAISFLVAMLVPGLIYGLEIIIGAVQALVFAVLTLVFSVQAMEAHHGDDAEHGHEAHH